MPDLPSFLNPTPEKLSEMADNQRIWRERAAVPNRKPTVVEQRVAHGRAREIAARASIEADPSNTFAYEQLAESLAEQGRYKQAIEVCPDGERKNYYEQIVTAIERPDGEECACEDDIRSDLAAHTLRLPRHHVSEWIWSVKHNREMPLVRCGVCGHLNARPLPKHLAQIGRATEKRPDVEVYRHA